MDARTQERDLIERDLPGAISKGDVRPYYQPLVDLQTKHAVGFEALARWQHPTLGEVSPERFIPVAESCGLMTELTDHLLRQAARDAAGWPDSLTLSFNISPSQLIQLHQGRRGPAGVDPTVTLVANSRWRSTGRSLGKIGILVDLLLPDEDDLWGVVYRVGFRPSKRPRRASGAGR